MLLQKLSYCLGLSQETKTELSDVIQETVIVQGKKTTEECCCAANDGAIIRVPGSFLVQLKGKDFWFTVNDIRLYTSVSIGDEVKVNYQKISEISRDYIPPDYNQKQEIGREIKYKYVSAERT